VTVIDRRNHHLFQPLLYQVATAALSPGDIASPIRWILRKQKNTRVLLAEGKSIDTATRAVLLDIGDLHYHYLVVATGAAHAYFGHDEWAANAPGLKSLDDALGIRRKVLLAFEKAERETDPERQRALLTFVIVGGGPTGVELAGALAEVAFHAVASDFRTIDLATTRILLLEGGPSLLPTFPEPLRAAAERLVRGLGVEVRLNAQVTAVEQGAVHVGSERIPAEVVLWAAGVAASPLGRTIGAPVDRAGRVVVEADLSVPGHPEVFVIGDLATFSHQGGKPLPGVAPVAIQQAKHVAAMIVRTIEGQPRRPFVYRNLGNLATIGRAAAVADFGRVKLTGLLAWLAWLFIHLMNLIGFRNRLLVLLQWAWSYMTYQRSVRLITGDDS
jgi:NADH dehydrogenase